VGKLEQEEHPIEIVAVCNSFQEKYVSDKTPLEQTLEERLMCEGNAVAPREIRRYEMADHVYEKAKSVWSFGKGVGALKPIMGLAEGVAVKALSVTVGVDDLEKVDTLIRERLNTFDKDLVDPAINRVWEVIAPYVGKGDDIVQSFIGLTKKKIPFGCEAGTEKSTSSFDDAVDGADVDTTPPSTESTTTTTADKITPTPIAPTH